MTFHRGEVVYLSGGNGSGKTTFAKLLTGLYVPKKGEIRLDGRTRAGSPTGELPRQLFSAVVLRSSTSFRVARSRAAWTWRRRAQECLTLLQLDHKVKIQQGIFSTMKLSVQRSCSSAAGRLPRRPAVLRL